MTRILEVSERLSFLEARVARLEKPACTESGPSGRQSLRYCLPEDREQRETSLSERLQSLTSVFHDFDQRLCTLESLAFSRKDEPDARADLAGTSTSTSALEANLPDHRPAESRESLTGVLKVGDGDRIGTLQPLEARMRAELEARGVVEPAFVRVAPDYYDHDLEYRKLCLSAASVRHLCKTIVMENTKAPPDFLDCGPHRASRYCCVVVQYAARLHADKLKRFVHKLNGDLGIKNFNMRLAPPDVSDALTGFKHNAVTPICMRTRLPVFVSHHIPQLEPDRFWLGAGEVDFKVGLSAKQFVTAYEALVTDCTYDETIPNASCLSA